MKILSLARLSVCSNHTGLMRPDSMTSATRMVAEDSLVWEIVAMAGMLPDGNRGASRDIVASSSWRTGYVSNEVVRGEYKLMSKLPESFITYYS